MSRHECWDCICFPYSNYVAKTLRAISGIVNLQGLAFYPFGVGAVKISQPIQYLAVYISVGRKNPGPGAPIG
jgi:hypothetical protein